MAVRATCSPGKRPDDFYPVHRSRAPRRSRAHHMGSVCPQQSPGRSKGFGEEGGGRKRGRRGRSSRGSQPGWEDETHTQERRECELVLPHRVTALGCTVPQKTPGEQTTHRSPSLTERGPAWLRHGAQFLQLTAGVPVPRLPFAPSLTSGYWTSSSPTVLSTK